MVSVHTCVANRAWCGGGLARIPGILRALSTVAMVMLLASCQDSRTVDAALPPGPPTVVVDMDEYHFQYDPAIPGGRVVFRFVNVGRLAHRPSLLPLSEEIAPIDEQVRGEKRAVVTPFVGVPPTEPGEAASFAVDLNPGQRYALVCFANGPDGEAHRLKGMTSEFRAGAVIGEATGKSG